MKQRILSGVQPTGDLHLGNYLGAIKQFVALQDTAECYFCVVDLHAITVKHDPHTLADNTRDVIAAYIACGIDPAKATIFAQSHVPYHTEMAWLLSCVARMGWMERMTQFKDKGGDDKERASVGLFTYPILMAADILTYRATHVPVGADQIQHLELARDIAKKFNKDYDANIEWGDPRINVHDYPQFPEGARFFPLPQPLVNENVARIMSLHDASKKMSKSDENPFSRINLSDDDDIIRLKVRKATATTEPFPTSEEGILRPEVDNLITIYAAVTGESRQSLFERFGGQGWGTFKPALSDALIAAVGPIRDRMAELARDRSYIDRIMLEGSERAFETASTTVHQAKKILGFARIGQ